MRHCRICIRPSLVAGFTAVWCVHLLLSWGPFTPPVPAYSDAAADYKCWGLERSCLVRAGQAWYATTVWAAATAPRRPSIYCWLGLFLLLKSMSWRSAGLVVGWAPYLLLHAVKEGLEVPVFPEVWCELAQHLNCCFQKQYLHGSLHKQQSKQHIVLGHLLAYPTRELLGGRQPQHC